MAVPTHSYVDPLIAADSGAGTVGDPWGDIQHALDTVTRDATNGDQINVKAGTDEILAAALVLTTYGTPSFTAPLIFRGYTTAANDGGIGGIDGNATYTMLTYLGACIHFIDMHLHSSGSANIISPGSNIDYCTIQNCELDNTTGGGIVLPSNGNFWHILGNNIHNISGVGINLGSATSNSCSFNYLKNGTNDFSAAISSVGSGPRVSDNIISIDGTSNGLDLLAGSNFATEVFNNSIFSAAGSGTGILIGGGAADALNMVIINNVVEGFSDTGGQGIDFNTPTRVGFYGFNHLFSNASQYVAVGNMIDLGDNEDLSGSSPFDKSGADTFANRFIYFAPADVGNMLGGSYPSGSRRDKGAVQHADPPGGAASILGGGNLHGGFL